MENSRDLPNSQKRKPPPCRKLLSYFTTLSDPNSLSSNMEIDIVYHNSYCHSIILSTTTSTKTFRSMCLKKAFDSVPHNELLLKPWKLGITGSLWRWFQSYLKGRFHYVTIDGASSPLLLVISGSHKGASRGHCYLYK